MKFVFYRLPFFTFLIVLFYFTHICIDQAPYLPSQSDKVMHFAAYAVLAFLFFRMNNGYDIKTVYLPSVILYVLALIDEVWQGFLICRNCSFFDFIADSLGIFFVSVIYFFYNRFDKNNQREFDD